MSFLSFGKKKEQVSLVIDVGNSAISCSLVLFREGDIPLFLYYSSKNFSISSAPDASKLATFFSNEIDLELGILAKKGFSHEYWKDNVKYINSAVVSFSSPWFILKTKHIIVSNEKEFIVSENFIDDVIEKEENIFIKELSNHAKDDFEIVESKIIHTKINGYTLDNPIGKKTTNLDAFLCMSVMDRGVLDTVFSSMLKYLHIPKEKISIHTFPVVSFSVIRDYFSGINDFIIMDISGDVTDVSLIQDGVISQTTSMPSGRNFILRQIGKAFDVSLEIAQSMLHMYTDEKLIDDQRQKMDEIVALIEKEWSIYFENALLELSPTMSLPTNLYLMSESDVSGIYSKFLTLQKIDATSTFRKSVNIINIDDNAVKKFYSSDSLERPDEFSVFVALFYKNLLKNE